jgi:predicted hydrocarbon binding protein
MPDSNVTTAIGVDTKASHITWARSNIALHSHHYHFQLQYTLNLTDFIDGGALTREVARWAIAALLRNHFGDAPADPARVLRFASALFQAMGFGRLDVAGASNAATPVNMYVDGWTPAYGYTKAKVGKCDFPAGFIAAALEVAYGRPFVVEETACKAHSAPSSTFGIRDGKELAAARRYDTAHVGGPAVATAPDGGARIAHNVDEAAIMTAVLGLPLTGDILTGLASKFGVLLNWTPQQYYSGLEYEFITRLADYDLGLERSAEELLFFDGEACALNTFHGITRSDEWRGLVKPMLARPGDAVVALAAVANCLGWGKAVVTDLVPGEGLTVELYGGQEGLGYRAMFGLSQKPRCYAFSGAVRALMEVFLPGEVVESKFGRFRVEETQCVAMGAPHCTFKATRSR